MQHLRSPLRRFPHRSVDSAESSDQPSEATTDAFNGDASIQEPLRRCQGYREQKSVAGIAAGGPRLGRERACVPPATRLARTQASNATELPVRKHAVCQTVASCFSAEKIPHILTHVMDLSRAIQEGLASTRFPPVILTAQRYAKASPHTRRVQISGRSEPCGLKPAAGAAALKY